MNIDILNIFIVFLQFFIAILGLYVLLVISKEIRQYIHWNRQNTSLNIISSKFDPVYLKMIDLTFKQVNWSKNKKLNIEDYKDLTNTLNTLEIISSGILKNIYDEKILKDIVGISFISYFQTFRPFIYNFREGTSISAYTDFEQLVRKWAFEMNISLNENPKSTVEVSND